MPGRRSASLLSRFHTSYPCELASRSSMLFLNARPPCFLLLLILHGALFADARPINSTSLSVSPRQTKLGEPLESIELDGKSYRLRPSPEIYQEDSDFYEIIGTRVPTILKVIENKGDAGERVQKEMKYSEMVDQYFTSKQDDMFYYLVLKDVRGKYPNPDSPQLKLFHEWYLENKETWAKAGLANFRIAIELSLRRLFAEKGLRYSDISLDNIYTDRDFNVVVPVNWAPPNSPGGRGVRLDVSKTYEALDDYQMELASIISNQINVKMLEKVLHRHGERLRVTLQDVDIKRIELDGNEYQIELLPKQMQGRFARTYDIIDGLVKDGDNVSAILKIVEGSRENKTNRRAEKEIYYLQKVNLYLTHKTDDNFYYLVTKDVRVRFPDGVPHPLKPFNEWLSAGKINGGKRSWKEFRGAIEKRLLKFAKEDGLLYHNFHLNDIFVDQELLFVMPVNWAPTFYVTEGRGWLRGVEEITTQDKKEREKIIKEFKKYLKSKLLAQFNY